MVITREPPIFHFYDWTSSNLYLEEELELRGDHFMIESEEMFWCVEYDDGMSFPTKDDPIFEFRVLQYNELTQNYEIDITETMTDEENRYVQKQLYNIYTSRAERDE